jgi:hypothetical protein
MKTDDLDMKWKAHTPNLLNEIAKHSGQGIYHIPLNIFGKLLYQVGQRAAELDDPILNDLMCRLTIYEIADPEKPGYDLARVKEIRRKAAEAKGSPIKGMTIAEVFAIEKEHGVAIGNAPCPKKKVPFQKRLTPFQLKVKGLMGTLKTSRLIADELNANETRVSNAMDAVERHARGPQ